jgi:hypothetical protein
MMVDFNKSELLGREGLQRVMERYPQLTKALLDLGIAEADDAGAWDLLRMLEAVLQQIRLRHEKRQGVKRGAWRAELPRYRGRAPGEWIDHTYSLRNGSGPTLFVSEPYNLSHEGIKHLARLADKGWEIDINAWRAAWVPGHTLYIALKPTRPGQRGLAKDIDATYESPYHQVNLL